MSSKWFEINEQGFKNEYIQEGGKLYRKQTQPTEGAILEHNAERKKQDQRKLSFGRYVGSIPNVILEKWRREHPELRCGDRQIESQKLLQLMRENPEVLVVDKSKL